MRQGGEGMGQRLAGMALGVETELAGKVGELRAHPRHLTGRCGERRAGPDAGMHRKRGNAALFDQRHDEQIERHAPVNIADEVRFDDHWRKSASAVEPGEGAFVARRGEQRRGARPANAERAGLLAVAPLHDMAQLREVAVFEPAQQRRAFRVGQCIGVRHHRRLQLRPVGNGGDDIVQHLLELRAQPDADPGIGAVGFEIDHRLAFFAGGGARRKAGKPAFPVAPDRDHRMHHPVDCEAMGSHRGADRIDDERQVVGDRGDAHQPLADRAGHRFDLHNRIAVGALPGGREHEARRLGQTGLGKRGIARQQRSGQPPGQRGSETAIGPVRLAFAHGATLSSFPVQVKEFG